MALLLLLLGLGAIYALDALGISDTNIPSIDDIPDLDWQNSSDNEVPDLADMGTKGNDTLSGSTDVDLMIGQSGNDKIFGYNDDDMIFGGAGDDTMSGGLGDDLIVAVDYLDEVGFASDLNNYYQELANNGQQPSAERISSIVDQNSAGDLTSEGRDVIFGGAGNDTILAGVDDTIISGSGEDLVLITRGEDETGVTIVKYPSEDDIILLTKKGAPSISNANGALLTLEEDGDDVLIKYDGDVWARVEKGVGKIDASKVMMAPF